MQYKNAYKQIALCTEMKLTFPLLNTTINVPVDEPMNVTKKSRRAALRNKKNDEKTLGSIDRTDTDDKIEGTTVIAEEQNIEKVAENVNAEATQMPEETAMQGLLMAEVVNVTHEKFRQTEEIKV